MLYRIGDFLEKYCEKNTEGRFEPVSVGKYGIRKRSDVYNKEIRGDVTKNKVIRKDTLCVGLGTSQIDIGILCEDAVYSVSPAYHTFKINTKIVKSEFLIYLFKHLSEELSYLYMISSVRQGKSVDFKRFLEHTLEIPEKSEQDKIVTIFNKLDVCIKEKKQRLIDIDDLVYSQFLKMIENSNQKNVLGDFISAYKAEKCKDQNLPVLSITKEYGIVLQEEKFKKRIASINVSTYKVVPRGILVQGIHIDERNFGIQNIVDKGIVSPAYKLWSVNSKKANPEVIAYALRTDEIMNYIKSKFSGSIKRRENITNSDFLAAPMNLPSLPEQNEFFNLTIKAKELKQIVFDELKAIDELYVIQGKEYFE